MITITQFKNRFTTTSSRTDTDLDAERFSNIVGSWRHTVVADKDAAKAFTMCNYDSAPNRKKENILDVTGIVLDVDGGNTAEQLVEAFEMLGPFAHCWYTTYSHTEVNPRVRIIVPISAPVTASDFEGQALALRLAQRLGLTVDGCCSDPSQLYYMPSKKNADSDCEIYVGESLTLFDIKALPAKWGKPSQKKSQHSEDNQPEIFAMVDSLVADMFGGVEPIFVGEKFHIYSNGVWDAVDPGRTFCKAIVDYHDRKMSIKVAMDLVFAMKIMFSADQFPPGEINKITLNGYSGPT